MGDGLSGKLSTNQTWTLAGGMTLAGGTYVLTQTSFGTAALASLGAGGGTLGVSVSLSGIGAGVTSAAATVGAGISSAASAVVGVLAAIPVAGWIALAVIAVAAVVWYFWDDIKAFFTKLWKNFLNWFKATIVYDWIANTAVPWVVDTANNVWNWVTDTAVPWVTTTIDNAWNTIATTVDDIGRRAEKQAAALALALAKAKADKIKIPKDDAVYLIKMITHKDYKKLIWGMPFGFHSYPKDRNGDPKYKYGTTKNGISGRYKAGDYVREQIELKHMSSIMIREYMDYWEARILEKQLIYYYFCEHGAFPPGNSKLG